MEQEERIRKSQEIDTQAGGEYERVLFNAEKMLKMAVLC
jgi:hypothetical protein